MNKPVSDANKIVGAVLSNTFFTVRTSEKFDQYDDEALISRIVERYASLCERLQNPQDHCH